MAMIPDAEPEQDSESLEPSTLPSPPSFRFDSSQDLLSRAGSGYESQYGSMFGSRFSLTDGSGVFVSSLALTIIVSAIAIVGIVLVAVIITLAVLLSSCQNDSTLTLQKQGFTESCSSFHLNAELNNIQEWVVPSICDSYIVNYIHGGQYMKDVEFAVDSARRHLKTLTEKHGVRHAIVFDIDETAWSNAVHLKQFGYSSAGFMDYRQSMWTNEAICSPILPVLNLYQELRAANWSIFFISERPQSLWEVTVKNLRDCGYEDWTSLVLWSPDDTEATVEAYKRRKRREIEEKGYQIASVIGDQWSDLGGLAAGTRSFKLPNPMYHIV